MRGPALKPSTEGGNRFQAPQRRQLQGPGGAVSSLAMSAGWLVAGGQAPTARCWKFTEYTQGGGGIFPHGRRQESLNWHSNEAYSRSRGENEVDTESHRAVELRAFSAVRRAQQDNGNRSGGGRGWARSRDVPTTTGRHQQGRSGVPFVPPPSVSPLSCRRQVGSEQQTSWQIVRPRPALLNTSRGS